MRYRAKQRRLRLTLAALLALIALPFLTARVRAQGGIDSTGTGGIHTIQGRVFFPTGGSGDTRVKVELETSERGSLSTLTGADGSFRFSNLLAGSYVIVVNAGAEYEVTRESLYIDRDKIARTLTVPVYLRYKSAGATPRAGVVDAALAGVPKQALELYQKGLEAAQSGDSKKAVEKLQAAVAAHQEFPAALNELGVQYLKLKQPDRAAEALATAVKLAPAEFAPRLNYGIALLNRKDYVGAETQLREALKKNEASPTAHMYLGMSLAQQHKLDEAERELLRAAGTGRSETAQAHKYLGGVYWSKREYGRAADELEKYLQLAPKAPDAEMLQNSIKELRGKAKAAEHK